MQIEEIGGSVVEVPVELRKATDVPNGTPSGLPTGFRGFVEGDGVVAMEAGHAIDIQPGPSARWQQLPEYGATLDGMTIAPATAESATDPTHAARLDYPFWLLDGGDFEAQVTVGPSLGFVPGRGLRYAIWLDDAQPVVVDILQENSDWAKAVSDNMRRVRTALGNAPAGAHVLHIAMVDPGVVLERVVLSRGKLAESYLGPPESRCGIEVKGAFWSCQSIWAR